MSANSQKSETLGALDSLRLLADSPTLLHVLKFAARMEAKLAKNRHKGNREGWLKDHPWNLVERVLDETVELQQCFAEVRENEVALITTPEETADECADVANFCMMVADCVTAMNSKATSGGSNKHYFLGSDPSPTQGADTVG